MSSRMYWRPAQVDPPRNDLPYALKHAIARRFWGHDGSLYGEEIMFDKAMLGYLEGLADAKVDGASDLVAAIKTHGVVSVWIGE